MTRPHSDSVDAAAIAELVRSGKKLEAIKALRASTGIGLREAKEEIERLSAGLDDPSRREAPPPREFVGVDLSPEVSRLANRGRMIEAIRLHRAETGVGLMEARMHIETAIGKKAMGYGPILVFIALVLLGLGVVIMLWAVP